MLELVSNKISSFQRRSQSKIAHMRVTNFIADTGEIVTKTSRTRRVGVGSLLQPVYPVVDGFPDVQQARHLILHLVSLVTTDVAGALKI